MGYRLAPPPPNNVVHIDATTTKSVISVDNGTITSLAFPCYYLNGELVTYLDIMRIDHVGWPSPDHADASWQPADACGEEEIDLLSEGYDSAEIQFDYANGEIVGEAWIEGNIVRVVVNVRCRKALRNDIDVPFSVTIFNSDEPTRMLNMITKGILHVSASYINISSDLTTIGELHHE